MFLAPLTALFTRSVMLRTRNPVVGWSRIGVGALLFIWLYKSESGLDHSLAPGRDLLVDIVWVAASVLALAVLISSSAAITEEKEQRTLGLLRMTGLHPFAILLAKSTARLCEALVLMASTLPLALLAVTLGGVSTTQVFAVYLALATWIAFVGNLGLFWSVVCRTGNAAAGAALASLLLVPVTLILMLYLTGGSYGPLAWIADLVKVTVFYRLFEILSTGYQDAVGAWSDVVHLGAALALFLASWAWFRRERTALGDDGPTEGGPRPLVAGVAGIPGQDGGGGSASVLAAGRPRAGLAAVVWKEFHFACGGRLSLVVWIALPIAITVILRIAEFSSSSDRHTWGWELGVITLIAAVVRVGGGLSHVVGAEHRAGTLDDLVALPCSPGELVGAKIRGVLVSAGPLLGMCVLSWLLVLGDSAGTLSGRDLQGMAFFVGSFTLEIAVFWLWCLSLSLSLPRGAFATACLAVVISNIVVGMFIGMAASTIREEAVAVTLWFLCLGGISVALGVFTAIRVRALGP